MLEGKYAVITGGSRGIGRAMAIEFARLGANVAILYSSNREAAEKTLDEMKVYGVYAYAFPCNVASFEETKNVVEEILKVFPTVDILVNNAGITKDGIMLTMTEENFDMVVDTNLKGAFNMTKHLYPTLMKRKSGRIINMTSVAGVMGNAGQANYASAKAGMIGLTKSIAKELGKRGVTCNAIAPGFIETEMTAVLSEKIKEAAVKSIPVNRMGRAEEIAKLASFLASEDAAYITGQVIQIDGGLCM
ncbi:MAG: 3-oxoacyl-[acyl-carrier-protein] reductase [Eubacteriales bacterium]|nr:3-oxoacyl-[acyl-carrier-protein] reductase [Eubacteriales bacterium]MDD3349327.1 3-oxoacyl-[acyl-carrier-protein] reductase [Eubacteriales bacterium]